MYVGRSQVRHDAWARPFPQVLENVVTLPKAPPKTRLEPLAKARYTPSGVT
jgi:hypothetical protein